MYRQLSNLYNKVMMSKLCQVRVNLKKKKKRDIKANFKIF